ncbi:hypothetical protein DUNSADRAFT_9831 [Dunaliella salina]|uniref:Encoded protein n=1 Tax=Dunaliella salina TaxID=3046 RepID=A0ABQ7GGJ2_DUNSA|nr:hypothetical protein DUNSADRAFT_9831 [Dunaliella salina]|eukprot:KAF5833724.1 hypothetical protein DUNSADRAFT_9831 [Dunaliella salina]
MSFTLLYRQGRLWRAAPEQQCTFSRPCLPFPKSDNFQHKLFYKCPQKKRGSLVCLAARALVKRREKLPARQRKRPINQDIPRPFQVGSSVLGILILLDL